MPRASSQLSRSRRSAQQRRAVSQMARCADTVDNKLSSCHYRRHGSSIRRRCRGAMATPSSRRCAQPIGPAVAATMFAAIVDIGSASGTEIPVGGFATMSQPCACDNPGAAQAFRAAAGSIKREWSSEQEPGAFFSASSIQFSIRLALATSPCSSQRRASRGKFAAICLLSSQAPRHIEGRDESASFVSNTFHGGRSGQWSAAWSRRSFRTRSQSHRWRRRFDRPAHPTGDDSRGMRA